jgi:3-hydroxyacyl-[acyl-carrier-protein] dehydratase
MTDLDAPLQSLPHGAGFRFVDALTKLNPGKAGAGIYRLRGDEAFFQGHFPGRPILPAVIMAEAIAQMAGIVVQSDPDIPAMSDLRLTAIRQMKITGTAVPGETLLIEAEMQGRMGNLVQAAGRVRVDEKVIAEGQVTLSGGAP